jgi:hypothetical protein
MSAIPIDEQPAARSSCPFDQAPQVMMLAARTTGDPEALTPSILATLAGMDPLRRCIW